ncbi:hypothetical protein [Oikeobacillus pervagus]|nr:hypothetical protein [Oikeobacillus pervagus]
MEEVSFEDFTKELKKEYEYQKNGGTSYRLSSSSLALVTAIETNSVKAFLDKDVAKQTVSYLLPTISNEKVEDVAKLLNMIAKDMHRKKNLPKEVQEYVQRKREKQKPLSLKNHKSNNSR